MTNRIKQLWADVRQDSDALFELRQMLFGVIIVVALIYGFYALYIGPKVKEYRTSVNTKKILISSSGGQELDIMLAEQMQKLTASKKELDEKVSFLQFKERILREQYTRGPGGEPFAKAIFTLLPLSPVDIENGFVHMKVLETRKFEFFDVSPIHLKGSIGFSELLFYLKYLEERPEVGMIGDMTLELPPAKQFVVQEKIHYDVVLGRIQLH